MDVACVPDWDCDGGGTPGLGIEGSALRFPAVANYSCRAGWNSSLHGPHYVRTATEDGEWAGRTPSCDGLVMARLYNTSEYDVHIFNTNLNTSQSIPGGVPRYPSQAVYACKDGYNSTQERQRYTRTANVDGQWMQQVPSCVGVPLKPLFPAAATGYRATAAYARGATRLKWGANTTEYVVAVQNTNAQPSQPIPWDVPRYPAALELTCRPGYNSSSWGPSYTRASTTDGHWDGGEPACLGLRMQRLYDTDTYVTGQAYGRPGLGSGQLLWSANTTEYTVAIRSTSPDPASSQPIPYDVPRFPALANATCRAGYNSSGLGPSFVRIGTVEGKWTGRVQSCRGLVMARLYSTTRFIRSEYNLSGPGLRWMAHTSEYRVCLRSTNALPSQTIPLDSPRFPAAANYSCRPGYNNSASWVSPLRTSHMPELCVYTTAQ
jgi:hypothetical protein